MPYYLLSRDSIRLRYETWGVGSSPLLLLHGLGSCADDWMMQLPAFAPYFHCLAVDLRGHGLSDKSSGAYSIGLFTSDIAALLAGLDMTPAHVLGLSLGGLVAQQLAITHPDMVRSLVLVNTFPGLWPLVWPMLRTAARRLPTLFHRIDMAATAARVSHDLFPNPSRRPSAAATEARLASNDLASYRRTMSAIVCYRPGRALRKVHCPALVVAGELDPVVPMAYKMRLRRRLPDARYVVVPGSRHASNVDRPEIVNQVVLDFLLELEGKRPATTGFATGGGAVTR